MHPVMAVPQVCVERVACAAMLSLVRTKQLSELPQAHAYSCRFLSDIMVASREDIHVLLTRLPFSRPCAENTVSLVAKVLGLTDSKRLGGAIRCIA